MSAPSGTPRPRRVTSRAEPDATRPRRVTSRAEPDATRPRRVTSRAEPDATRPRRVRKATASGRAADGPGAELRVQILNRSAGPDGERALRGPRLGAVETALGAAARSAARRFGGEAAAFGRAVNVVWLRDSEMRRLNRRFRGLSGTTDVLAWPGGSTDPGTGLSPPGEIACNLELARRSAGEHGNSIEAEAILYAVHGLVHLLGGKDDRSHDRRAMREVEVAALAAAGLEVRGGEWGRERV